MTLGGVQLRQFEPADLAAVRELIEDTIEASYSGVYSPRAIEHFRQHHSAARILERCASGRVLVAQREDRLVATGSVVGDEIAGVFVSFDCQHAGIGASVMDELEAIAQAAGRVTVQLSASLPSVGFYEHRGYSMLEARSVDVGAGERLDYWLARKCLRGES